MRRFTRLTNAFSKKLGRYARTVVRCIVLYNFVLIHKALGHTLDTSGDYGSRLGHRRGCLHHG